MSPTHVYDVMGVSFLLGSGWNSMDAFQSDTLYDLHINCSALDIACGQCIKNSIDFFIHDDNRVNLLSKQNLIKLQATINAVYNILLQPSNIECEKKKILFTCWVGASRSCCILLIVLIVILKKRLKIKSLQNETFENAFLQLYNQIKASRGCVSLNTKLYEDAIYLLKNDLLK